MLLAILGKRFAVVFLSLTIMNPIHAMSAPPQKEPKAYELSQTLEQMHWKLADRDWDFGLPYSLGSWKAAGPKELDVLIKESKREGSGSNLHRTVEALILENDPASRQRALEILQKLVAIHDVKDINAVVTEHGVEYPGFATRQESSGKVYEITAPNEQRPQVFNVRNLAYEYAALYLLTGDPAYAEKAKAILLRFAEVVHAWPLYDRANQPRAQDEIAYLRYGNANGLWSTWAPLDLANSLPLLRAYDILRPALTEKERKTLETDLFMYHKNLLDGFQLDKSYNNLVGSRLLPLFRFGQVLQRPEYIHEAVKHWRELLLYSYAPDGFWKELSPAYHQQITGRLVGMIAPAVRGYSDPAGYVYAKTGERFEDLDLERQAAAQLVRMEEAQSVLAMPDGYMVSLNDDWPKGQRVPQEMIGAINKPGLLGVSGVAKLGVDGMVAFLQFDGTRGHDHDDALNLNWFAGGREVFSDTGYQALPGSDSSRTWHTISASHNTVAVNEKTQFSSREGLDVPAGSEVKGGRYPVVGLLPEAARTVDQGRLLLWSAEHGQAQAMEAEQENAYPGVTSLFRRTVVMVPTGNGDGYLVDIFRIVGGRTHDFFLRGGLDKPYTMSFNQKLQPVKKSAYEFMAITEEGPVQLPLVEKTTYEDGYEVVSRLGKVLGTDSAKLDLLVGNAPAIRRLGRAPVSILRRSLPSGDEKLKSTYVWVHAAGKAGKEIQDVKVESEGENVTVIVERTGSRDMVFSGPADNSRFEPGDWQFTGRLAYASQRGEEVAGVVFGGEALQHNGIVVAPAQPSLKGLVLSTTNRDAGEEADSLLVRMDGGALPEGFTPRLAHIDFGDVIRFSIPVESAEVEEGGLRLKLKHGPGFVVDGGQLKMTSFPGWVIASPASIRLDGRTAPVQGSPMKGDSQP